MSLLCVPGSGGSVLGQVLVCVHTRSHVCWIYRSQCCLFKRGLQGPAGFGGHYTEALRVY